MQIICLSHLAWEPTLFQRPQQLMLRFARAGHEMLYFGCVGGRRVLQLKGGGGREALRGEIRFPSKGSLSYENVEFSAFSSRRSALMRSMYANLLADRAMEKPANAPRVVWIYHPSLLTITDRLEGDCIVYDVMDRFDAFAKSADAVHAAEYTLLQRADVIFAGGRSLQSHALGQLQAVSRNVPVHYQPSGVELQHFEQALSPALPIPADVAGLPRPIFGYFGAVDERLDFEIIGHLCASAPHASVLLIGPQLISPPKIENLHSIGARPYKQLPAYLKAFDVALLPFLQSQLVAHISPTKTPEYLAGGKPVVSTSIPDVIRDYRDIVTFADSPEDFARKCGDLAEHPPDPWRLCEAARSRAKTWDRISSEMLDEVSKAIRIRR